MLLSIMLCALPPLSRTQRARYQVLVQPPIFALPQSRSRRRAALAAFALAWSSPLRAEPEPTAPACYPTAGGALEICRSGGEPEGVLYAPPPCRFGYGVQIIRLKARNAPGPLQVVFHAEPVRDGGKASKNGACEADLRATDPAAGGSVRTGRLAEQLPTMGLPASSRTGARAGGSGRRPRPILAFALSPKGVHPG
ncbi:hypothetical protein FV217_05630, partial [Methylobacterium sp. WL9]